MTLSRRTLLLGGLGTALAAAGGGVLAQVGEIPVSVTDYRRAGDRDDTPAFARALATGRPVFAPAGGGSGRSGAYDVTDCQLPAGARISGEGELTVIRPRAGRPSAFRADSHAADAQVADITLRDLTLYGRVEEAGFIEHAHLLRLDGVREVLVERVAFRGFQGDGLYLGSGVRPGQERHNSLVTVRSCRFDGINRDNRNAISVIDGDGITIQGCTFVNCSRDNMPGPIDFEPDAQRFAVIRNIVVEDCLFENNGGSVGEIAMIVPAAVPALPRNIAIRNNQFRSYRGTGGEVAINVARATTAADPDMAVTITSNRGEGGHAVYLIVSAKGVRASGNSWSDYRGGVLLGYTEPTSLARNVAIADRFVRAGQRAGTAFAIFQAINLSLEGTEIEDAGTGSADSSAILFAARGRTQNVRLVGVTVRSPTGRTRRAVVRQPGHALQAGSNEESGNDFGGLPSSPITL